MKLVTTLGIFFISLNGINPSVESQLPFMPDRLIKVKQQFGSNRQYRAVYGPRQAYPGILFELKNNSSILAIQDGVVVSVCDTCKRALGKRIKIQHNDSTVVTYHHLGSVSALTDQKISKGQEIGRSGNSGRTTVHGLGIRVSINGSLTNPTKILDL